MLIAFSTITIRITDSFSIDYADFPNYLITSFHGLLPTCLQSSSSASVEDSLHILFDSCYCTIGIIWNKSISYGD